MDLLSGDLKARESGLLHRVGGHDGLGDGLEVVEQVMKGYRPVAVPGLPRFTGGAVGFIGYEFIHDVEPVVPRPPQDELKTPVMYFLIADELLVFDRAQQTITILVNAILDDAATPAEAYENATSEIDRLVSLLEQPSEHKPVTLTLQVAPVAFTSNITAGPTPPRSRASLGPLISRFWQDWRICCKTGASGWRFSSSKVNGVMTCL